MSGDTKRTVSTAPPPRREVEVNLDTDAATDERPETPPSRPLDLGGFSDPGATDGPVGVAERSTDRQSTTTTPRKSTRRARKPAAAGGYALCARRGRSPAKRKESRRGCSAVRQWGTLGAQRGTKGAQPA